MKTRLFLAALILCSALTVSAQVRPSFGIRAGVNFQNLNGKNSDGDRLENDMKTGFNVGVNAEVPVAPDFFIQPGLLYTTKGARQNNVIGNADAKINLTYLELPVNFLYKPLLGTGHLLLGFGPYLGYALDGKFKVGDAETDIEFSNDGNSSVTNPRFRRFDAGANLLFGYEMTSRLSAQLNAQLGLVNISPGVTDIDDDGTVKNTGFGISLGYRF